MFPHEHERRDTVSTIGTADTVDSTLTDSLAVCYRHGETVARRFVDGYWSWQRPMEFQLPMALAGSSPEDGEEAERSWLAAMWRWALLRWQ